MLSPTLLPNHFHVHISSSPTLTVWVTRMNNARVKASTGQTSWPERSRFSCKNIHRSKAIYRTQLRPESTVTSAFGQREIKKGPPTFFPPSFFPLTEGLWQLDDLSIVKIPWRQRQHWWHHHPATQTQALYTPAVSSGSWVHCYPSPAVSSVLSVADCEQRSPSEPESGHCMLEL